jgi:hypothetical protein
MLENIEQLRCEEVLPITDSLNIDNNPTLLKPSDFQKMRRNDDSKYNYAATFVFRTFQPPQNMEDLIFRYSWGQRVQQVRDSVRATTQTISEASNINVQRNTKESVNSAETTAQPKNHTTKKYCSSKFRLPLDKSVERQRDIHRLQMSHRRTQDTKFLYTPMSLFSDLHRLSILPSSPASVTKVPVIVTSEANQISKMEDTQDLYKNYILSYPWDCLQLGTRLGTPAYNSNQLVHNAYDVLPLQMLQMVNTLRPKTLYLPQMNDSGESVLRNPNFHIPNHILECDITETIHDIISSTFNNSHSLSEEYVDTDHAGGKMNESLWTLDVPYSDVEELFQTMLAQDVNDGCHFRHETLYLPPGEVIEYLRSLENDAYRLQHLESEILTN